MINNNCFQLLLATNKEDINTAFALRIEVFVREQKISEQSGFDKDDDSCLHFLLKRSSDQKAVGSARLIIEKDVSRISRVCVLKEYRGKRLGTFTVTELEAYSRALKIKTTKIRSQIDKVEFYRKIGYEFEDLNEKAFGSEGVLQRTLVKRLE